MTNSKIILIMFIVLFILSLPTSFLSPSPAVSINKTGPIDINSIALNTGSVVVPAIFDTIAISCPQILFIKDDLPAFVLPNIGVSIK